MNKLRLHPYLSDLVSPHFQNNILPKLVFPVSHPFVVTQKSFLDYFMKVLSLSHRQHSLCFFMSDLVDMVNKTNGRLLYESLLSNIEQARSTDDEDKYQLLSVFEMLWNVDSKANNCLEDETGKTIKGHALTVKEEFLEGTSTCLLFEICTRVRNAVGQSFLESESS